MDETGMGRCPYCGQPLERPAMPPAFIAASTRDSTVGFALGLAVAVFMDVGVFVRPDPTPFGFGTNVIIAYGLTGLLIAWYRGMRHEVETANARDSAAWQAKMDAWQRTYRCDRCNLVFRR